MTHCSWFVRVVSLGLLLAPVAAHAAPPEKGDAFVAQVDPGVFTKAVNQAVEQDVQRFDLNPELRKFKFPALVVTGRFDINVAPSVAYKIHKAIPGSRFVVFERSGHLPFYEEPEAFVRALEEFLE